MRLLLTTLSFILLLNSCSDADNELPSEDFAQKSILQEWKLYKMTSSLQGIETTGTDMEWQESYQFNADSTFSKTRKRNNETVTSTGSFTTYIDGTEESILLNYLGQSSIIGGCTNDLKEHLYYDVNNDVLLSNWWACDGPGLFYKRD